MRIGELSKRAGVSVETIRFYERDGLLRAPPRSGAGYRLYGEDDERRLRFIRRAKDLGFSLAEIRGFLQARDGGECPCQDVLAVADQHLRDVRQRIGRLEAFAQILQRALNQWRRSNRKVRPNPDEFCRLIEGLGQK